MFLTLVQGTLEERVEESFMTRIKRAACDPQGAESCAKDAINTYTNALFQSNGQPKSAPAGAKPDYQERKTCNFLLDTEKCFSKLENCNLPAAQVKAITRSIKTEVAKEVPELLHFLSSQFGRFLAASLACFRAVSFIAFT